MNNSEDANHSSDSNAQRQQHQHVGQRREPSRHDSQEQEQSARAPRLRASRLRSNSSDRFDVRFPRVQPSESSQISSPVQETTRLISRDYFEQNSSTTPTLRRVRNPETSIPPPSIRRRVSSAQPSRSPGPSQSRESFLDPRRRSVAIAATSGRDPDVASRKFSLAGPGPLDTLVANQPYVDPGYAHLNPAYDQPANVRPVWGLAKPLPHVLRPGMVPAKDELEKDLLQQREEQHQAETSVDLESGGIEPTLRPDKITSQLDNIRREREIQLVEAYRQQYQASPAFSPFGRTRRPSATVTEVPDLQPPVGERIIEEDEEQQHRSQEYEQPPAQQSSDLDLTKLNEAMANVGHVREEEDLKVPYEDAIPLLAYEAEDDEIHNLHTYWSVIRLRFREPLAELLAITVQFTLGFSANLSLSVSRGAAGVGDTGDWAWGLATMVAIYIAGGISGAHLNPAISIMLCIYRGFPLRKVPIYIAAQMLGAFLATLIAFGIFQPGLIALQVGRDLLAEGQYASTLSQLTAVPQASAVLVNFITFPRTAWVDISTAFLTEMTGTSILTVSVLALGDDTNAPPGAGMNAFIIGLVVALLGMALGYNTGLAMNPARDFGPRVALAVLGYGRGPLSPSLFADGYWFRVAWLGPLAGTILGGFLYDTMIFVGGESPVNYPTERMKRVARNWRNSFNTSIGRTRWKARSTKDDIMGSS